MRFREVFEKLIQDYPVPFMFGHSNENAIGDYCYHCKDSYMVFDGDRLVDCVYAYDSERCTNCVDVNLANSCENCYMCFSVYKCNSCSYVIDCSDMIDCEFCFNCKRCQDCFGCVSLNGEQYCFFNKKKTKDEYIKAVSEYKKSKSPKEILADLKQLAEKFPVVATVGLNDPGSNTDFTDDVRRSQNVYMSFSVCDSSDVLYSYDSYYCNDSSDLTFAYRCNGCYNCVDSGRCTNCIGMYFSYRMVDCMYCYYCKDCQDCLGCVGLEKKRFCVLNRQVSEDEYKEIKRIITEQPNSEIKL